MPDETDEQILARYRQKSHDLHMTMSTALDLNRTAVKFGHLKAKKLAQNQAAREDKLERIRRKIFSQD